MEEENQNKVMSPNKQEFDSLFKKKNPIIYFSQKENNLILAKEILLLSCSLKNCPRGENVAKEIIKSSNILFYIRR